MIIKKKQSITPMENKYNLTESELRNIIRRTINEEVFDWSAFENPDRWRQTNRDVKYLKAQMKDNLDIPHANPYYHDEYDRDEDNDYSWEQWDNRPIALSPVTNTWSSQEDIPDDIDYAIDKNNKRLYGDETKTELIGNQARDKWVNGKSPDYMEGWTDAKLEHVIRESVRKTLNEVSMEDFEDDGEWLDLPNQKSTEYKVDWSIRHNFRYDNVPGKKGWGEIDSGREILNSRGETISLIKDIIKRNWGEYITKLNIEKRKDTLVGYRWERIWTMDGMNCGERAVLCLNDIKLW